MELIIPKKRLHVLHASFKHIRNGKIIWEQKNVDNLLHDQGEIALLSAYFATAMATYGAPPANLYLGLDARYGGAGLAEGDTLASLSSEPVGLSGYSRQALSTGGTGLAGQDFYINQPAAYYRADGKTITWTAGENWTAVTDMFLCTVISGTGGKLICSLPLTASRTLLSDGVNNDSLQASIQIGLSEP